MLTYNLLIIATYAQKKFTLTILTGVWLTDIVVRRRQSGLDLKSFHEFFKVSADSYNFRFRSLEALRIKNYTNALCQKYLP